MLTCSRQERGNPCRLEGMPGRDVKKSEERRKQDHGEFIYHIGFLDKE